MQAHPFFGTVAWFSRLFSSPLTLPGVVTMFRVCLPRAPALRQVLVAVLAEGGLESPSVLVLLSIRLSSLWEGRLMGQRLVIVSSPLGGCVSFTPFRLCSVASALSLSESWLFFLLWICRWYCGSGGAVPQGNFCGSHEGWVFRFSPWFEFCLTSSLSFPGCSHPGLVVAPSPGFDFTGLVASGSSELGAAQLVLSVLSLRHILAFVRCELQSPLVSSLTAARLGLWPYGLAIAALPLVSRPWTGLCWSHLLSLSSVSVFVVLPRQLVGSGVYSPASSICPTSGVLKRSSFGIAAWVFASSHCDGVTLPGRVCLSPRSERSLFLPLPGVWLESSRWGHPVGSILSQISIGTKTLCAPSLVVGA